MKTPKVKVRFHDPFDIKICQLSNIRHVLPVDVPKEMARSLIKLWAQATDEIVNEEDRKGRTMGVRYHRCQCGRWWFKITKLGELTDFPKRLWTADFDEMR